MLQKKRQEAIAKRIAEKEAKEREKEEQRKARGKEYYAQMQRCKSDFQLTSL